MFIDDACSCEIDIFLALLNISSCVITGFCYVGCIVKKVAKKAQRRNLYIL